MIRALIVDDEKMTRNGLVRHIKWEQLGVDEVQTAASSNEALQMLDTLHPDLVISDIRMPGMNGVELCQEIRRRQPHCQIIFLTAYSDKEYLKAAIEIGALGYVEKPVVPGEVEDEIIKAVKMIRQLQNMQDKNRLELTLQDSRSVLCQRIALELTTDPLNDMRVRSMKALGMFQKAKEVYRVCLIQSSSPMENMNRLIESQAHMLEESGTQLPEYYLVQKNSVCLVMLIGTDKEEDLKGEQSLLMQILQQCAEYLFEKRRFFVSAGCVAHSLGELPQSYRTAVMALQKLFYYGYGRTACFDHMQLSRTLHTDPALFEQYRMALQTREVPVAMEAEQHMYSFLQSQSDVLPNLVREEYNKLTHELLTLAEKEGTLSHVLEGRGLSEYYRRVGTMETLHGLHDELRRLLQLFFQDRQFTKVYNVSVMQVLHYIHRHYSDENLSVKKLAEQVFLTPTYLSNLFKQEVGKTIGQYITEVRIERSKELLRDKRFKLYHVAQQVGYSDSNYYAKAFKKQTGCTPSEYREKWM